ncbi:uncharacterized protein LOC144313622 isoform X1 [Canis aureus]
MDTGTVENLGLFMQSIYQRYHKTSVPFTLITASLEMSVPVSVLTATGAGSCQDLLRSLIEVYVITACLGEILNQTIALEHWNREFNQRFLPQEPRCPSKGEWIKKMWFMYPVEYSSAIRNDKYPPFASTWMELEGIMQSEIRQSEKDKQCMFSFIWGI